jgi:8-oxo-dGTP diphosphatase
MDDLKSFPRPNVAIDLAILTVLPAGFPSEQTGRLAVLVHERTDSPRGHVLPGRFLREGETIDDCIDATLSTKVGIAPDRTGRRHLLRVFDTPGRDPRGWTISLAHYLAVPPTIAQDARGRLVPIEINGNVADTKLLFDHDLIISEAASTIRDHYELEPDPDGLLDGPFTLADLRHLHEAVLGERVRRDTFRRRIEPTLVPHLSEEKHETRIDGGRPARLWKTPPLGPTFSTSDRVRLPREK